MADFKTPNLCGANETLNGALSKIKNLKDEIIAQSTALPSVKKAAFESKLADVKAGLDALAIDLPEAKPVNFQSEITSLINDIDKTTAEGLAAFNLKVAELKKDFGGAISDKGLDFDNLISESTTKLGKDISTASTALSSVVTDATGAVTDIFNSVTDSVSGVASNISSGLGISGVPGNVTPSLDAFGGTGDAVAGVATPTTPTVGNICALVPNFELPASAAGTGVTTQEIEERVSNAATITLTQTPKEILEVTGKKTTQSFFTNIQYNQNGKTIVPKATGTYSDIKVLYTVSLIKEKPVEAKQADTSPEAEEVSIVTTNASAVEKKTEFKFSSLIKKLDNLSGGSIDTTKANSDISSALAAIKSPEFKAKMQADLDYAASERKKLFADPLNYKQVTVNSASSSSSGKTRTVKVDTVETQNTTTTETVTTSGGGVTQVKRTSKATISDKGFTHRQVRKKEYFRRPGFTISTSTIANEKTGKTFSPKAVKRINAYKENELLTSSANPTLVMKNVVYDPVAIIARSYVPDGTFVNYRWGFKGDRAKLQYQSVENNILPDWTTADKNLKLEYNNRVTNKLEPSFPTVIDLIRIVYTYVEKIDPNYSG